MSPDDIIALRRRWWDFTFSDDLPADIVLATDDWLAYVSVMTDTMPVENVEMPTEEECRWAWPNGVIIVFEHPVMVEHRIISYQDPVTHRYVEGPPRLERQQAAAFVVHAESPLPSRVVDGNAEIYMEVPGWPTMWIGVDPHDLITGRHSFGTSITVDPRKTEPQTLSHSARFQTALIIALGHRLTAVREARSMLSRPEARRLARAIPDLRVLELAAGATVERSGEPSTVEWSKRWFVKGYWRQQPHGPGSQLRKLKWVDPYIKGPADKPLDVRPTIWRTP